MIEPKAEGPHHCLGAALARTTLALWLRPADMLKATMRWAYPELLCVKMALTRAGAASHQRSVA